VTAASTFTDIRSFDPKFQPPRLAQYAAATAELAAFAREHYGKSVVELAVRWILDRSPHTVALLGGHKPQQLESIPACFGWTIDGAAMEAIDAIVAKHVLDPVGPEYLTPDARTLA